MNIALITDIHYGWKNDIELYLDYKKQLFDEIFFPYIDEHNIKVVCILGDLVDRRKFVNYKTANRMKEDFLEKLKERNLEVHVIVGNHDVYYKDTNRINALDELVQGKYGFNLYIEATEITINNTEILLVPWINSENHEHTQKMINQTKAQICFGHLELNGFEMQRGIVKHDGEDPQNFSKFDIVCSGHYHHKSQKGSIYYLGAPLEFTWADYKDPKGFHVFNTETRELQFIRNPNEIYKKIFYNDKDNTLDQVIDNFHFDHFTGKIVKVIVQEKTNPFWFDLFIDNLHKHNVSNIQIVEDHHNFDEVNDSELLSETEDTLTVCLKFIDSIENNNMNKDSIKKLVSQVYLEAQALE